MLGWNCRRVFASWALGRRRGPLSLPPGLQPGEEALLEVCASQTCTLRRSFTRPGCVACKSLFHLVGTSGEEVSCWVVSWRAGYKLLQLVFAWGPVYFLWKAHSLYWLLLVEKSWVTFFYPVTYLLTNSLKWLVLNYFYPIKSKRFHFQVWNASPPSCLKVLIICPSIRRCYSSFGLALLYSYCPY